MQAPVLLAILDGWGLGDPVATNAVHMARTPNMDAWWRDFPHTRLTAHNGLVGLPEGQMGNSEVGHLNIGAGRIVYQDYTRINLAVKSGELDTNPALCRLMDQVRGTGGRLHFMGLVSDGGVHSHLEHLLALVRMAAARGAVPVAVHAFMDGRDTPPQSGAMYMEQLIDGLHRAGAGRVATVCGRYWAMDRDTRWERVERAWQALVGGRGEQAPDPLEAVRAAYARGETDEFIAPTVVDAELCVRDGDAIVFFNFRADRVRELCRAFIEEDFSGFPVPDRPRLRGLVTMTEYDAEFNLPVAFPPQHLHRILGEELSRAGLRQLRIAETEKYAHVTYFFNGGEEEPFPLEDRVLIESPRNVATYDEQPEMSAPEVARTLVERLRQAEDQGQPYALVVLNFANGDMVGHTGVLEAAIQACETVDTCLGEVVEAVLARGGAVIITADHGNAEVMVDPDTGAPHTAHTLNPVPFILVDPSRQGRTLRPHGALRDIAPTILELMGLDQPGEMEGQSLIQPA